MKTNSFSCKALGALIGVCIFALPLFANSDSGAIRVPRLAVRPHLQDIIPGGAAGMVRVSDLRQNAPKDGEPVTLGTSVYLGH
ncbi:MAG TPA: hypothetical protein VKB93_19025, partial [Thermoanaerobaculia bacterium]|nr:hypothetical protein [Thermoanaerobaculia bacterium]